MHQGMDRSFCHGAELVTERLRRWSGGQNAKVGFAIGILRYVREDRDAAILGGKRIHGKTVVRSKSVARSAGLGLWRRRRIVVALGIISVVAVIFGAAVGVK